MIYNKNNNLDINLANRLSEMVMPKKSRAYATTVHMASGQANCLRSQMANSVPHNLVPIKPNTTASIAVSSITKPLISPLTRPIRRGNSMMISSQDTYK